jgi:predicted CXXCH cytochrome family protein
VAVNWRHALHMVNNLTCVTCHDLMANEDRVLFEEQQAAVCTTCHKAQRSGIHDLGEGAPDNPPCSLCHNPHDHESAATRMRENQSLGCVVCHDQAQMESLAILNTQAGKYHRVMAEQARSCIDCHEGIAHAPEDSAPPMHPHPVRERTVVLFHPGHINHQWLLREHPGSQPLRQGAHCRRCHRGDEAAMGASLAAGFTPSHREVSMAFAREVDQLVIDLSWEGPAADRHLALMWGDASYPTFRQAGCFAACHGGEQGNARELFGKYPYAAEKSSDQSAGTMDIPAAAGQRAELWRIPLGSAAPDTALLSGDAGPRPGNRLSVERHYSHGQWSVTLRLQLDTADSGIHFSGQGPYTFAVALHGAENPGRAHWVSLPLTLSFGGNDTDFTAQ